MTAILSVLNEKNIYFIGDTAISVVDDNNKPKRIDGEYHKVGTGKGFIYAIGGDVPWGDKVKSFLRNNPDCRIKEITEYCKVSDDSTDGYRNTLMLGVCEEGILKIIQFNSKDGYKPQVGIGDNSAQFDLIGYNQQAMEETMIDVSYRQKYTGDGKTFVICEIAQETFKTGNCECIGGDYLDVAFMRADGIPRMGEIPMEGIYADRFKI